MRAYVMIVGVPNSVSTTAIAAATVLPPVAFLTVAPTTKQKTARRTTFCHVTHTNGSMPISAGRAKSVG
jgi:hypothetical protein